MIAALLATASIFLGGCDALLDTSLDMSPAPGVGVSVGVSTPISGWWDDDSYFPPYWSGSIAGPPVWGIGAPVWNGGWGPGPARPPRPDFRPGNSGNNRPHDTWRPAGGNNRPSGNWRPSAGSQGGNRPVVPPAGTMRPYNKGVGPVIGGSSIPVLHPGRRQ